MIREISLPLVARERRVVGHLRLHCLPFDASSIVVPAEGSEHEATQAQLLENSEYRYEIDLGESEAGAVSFDRQEVFFPDDESGLRGRLKPGLHTGLMPVTVTASARWTASVCLEIRSARLNFESEYRWMLRDIAEIASELVLDQFAASEQRLAADPALTADSAYQRFAFVRSMVVGGELDAAMQEILARPFESWEGEERWQRPGQGWVSGSEGVRELVRGNHRTRADALPGVLGRAGVPALLRVLRAEPTRDNIPNRFVRHALEGWLSLCVDLASAQRNGDQAVASRRSSEISEVMIQIQSYLAHDMFRDVGKQAQGPGDNQVLQRRAGYRDLLRMWILADSASSLSWAGGEEVFGAGQKNVAALYEYWVFLRLARALSEVLGKPLEWGALIGRTREGGELKLRQGRTVAVGAEVVRRGRQLRLELSYNRTFSPRGTEARSWTRPFRPDCSLRIESLDGRDSGTGPLWLHFDAKYRVDRVDSWFELDQQPSGGELEGENASSAVRTGRARSDDLAKMHAYRDAIRWSAGAYVLYPGSVDEMAHEYHELLPGLGAFALRPVEQGVPIGEDSIRSFLSRTLDHVALQSSQHERSRYWSGVSHSDSSPRVSEAPFAEFLAKPPADVAVLLAPVRDQQQLAWIHATGLYPIAVQVVDGVADLDSDFAASSLAVLYGPDFIYAEVWAIGRAPKLLNAQAMSARDYPVRDGTTYICLPISPVSSEPWRTAIPCDAVRQLAAARPTDGTITQVRSCAWSEVAAIAVSH